MSYYRTLLNYGESALKNALLAVYKFENNGNDSLGIYNATSIGSAVTFSSTNAVNGLAIQTANSINTRISLAINTFSFTTGTVDKAFSIKANIYLRGLGAQQTILSKYNGNLNNTSEYFFFITNTNRLCLILMNRNTGYIGAQVSIGNAFLINTNYNVVVTYDGTGIWTGIKMYINGVSISLSSVNSGTYLSMKTTTLIPTIGNSVVQNNPFIGMLDELYVFNGAISQTDVTTLQTQYYPNF